MITQEEFERVLGLFIVSMAQSFDLADWGVLISQSIFGMSAPVVRGGDDDAVLESALASSRKEAVNVTFLDPIIFRVEFALDGVELVCARRLRHQIYTGVLAIQALILSPNRIRPHVAVEVAICGLGAEVSEHELFEIRAFLAFGNGGISVRIQKGGQCRHGYKSLHIPIGFTVILRHIAGGRRTRSIGLFACCLSTRHGKSYSSLIAN